MSRPPIDQARWQPCIDHVCAAVGVDPNQVDLAAIHALAGEVAGTYERPMGPVSTHLWGIARASGPAPADAHAAIVAAREAGEARS